MREVLFSDRIYAYLDETGQAMLNQAQQNARDAGLNTRSIISTSDSSCAWFPWTGTSAITTLALLAEYAGLGIIEVSDGLSIDFNAPAIDVITAFQLVIASLPDPLHLAKNHPDKQRRKYDEFLDETLLDRSLACDLIDIPEAMSCLTRLVTDS